MIVDAYVRLEGSNLTSLRISFDNSELHGMSEEEKKQHIDEIVKEQVLDQLQIEWMEEKRLSSIA